MPNGLESRGGIRDAHTGTRVRIPSGGWLVRYLQTLLFLLVVGFSRSSEGTPVAFSLDSIDSSAIFTVAVDIVGGPVVGSGDLVFDASGNLLSGELTLPAYTLIVDVFDNGIGDLRIEHAASTQILVPAVLVSGVAELSGGSVSGGAI